MIDYDTILSTTEDKMTLLQWLKKVEAALKDASATTFKVNKKGDATLTFSIVFADGSEIESGEIVLQQGESVVSGEIVNGHLLLTLSNGDVLDTGTLFNGNINIAGDLSVTGKLDVDVITSSEDEISAEKPIVELMQGYRYTPVAPAAGLSVDTIYAGVVKNGNKLTLVHFFKITKTSDYAGSDYANLGQFTIPVAVANKIYPNDIGGSTTVVAFGNCSLFYNSPITKIDKIFNINKYGVTNLTTLVTGINSMSEGTPYYGRIEATFLLSDNLAA